MGHRVQECGPGSSCRNFKVLPMTDAFRQAILDVHNEARSRVARGEEAPQPPAANMNVLNWNEELEFIAQCWANACQYRHDKCRRTEHLVVGQNIARLQRTLSGDGLEDVEVIKYLIRQWYNEVEDFHPANVRYHTDGGPIVGHYTQMVWAKIQYIGCAGSLFKNGDWYAILFVCNYGGPTTGGNLQGAQVYEVGKPCSQCPYGTTCNENYKGLCGINYPVQTCNSTQNSALGDI
ncbi:uncharacterized protein CBL_11170 [Carabus blaptoides fortunei]